MNYLLPLTEDKVKPQQITALHLLCALVLVCTGAIFSYYFTGFVQNLGFGILVAGMALLITVIAKNKVILRREVNRIFRVVELLIFLCLLSYAAMHQWKLPMGIFGVVSAAILFAIYWENAGSNRLAIQMDENGAKLPVTSRRRSIAWHEIQEVLLRYGTLTIDCYDNQFYQWDIDTVDFDDEIFEAWCKARIEANEHKRIKNDW